MSALMLWELRWLGIAVAALAVAVLVSRGARPWVALGGTALLVSVGAPLWPGAWSLAAPYALWALPGVVLIGVFTAAPTATALGAACLGLSAALTATTSGLSFAVAALAGGAIAVALHRYRAALVFALLGPTTWAVLHLLRWTVPDHPGPAWLLLGSLLALTARHARSPASEPPTKATWAWVALIPLTAFGPYTVAAAPLAEALSTDRIATDDRLGWRWWVRYGPSPSGASDSGSDAGP